jgi:drug/metabolite transporter (DMT)-like permease
MGRSMSGLTIFGAILAVVGLLALAVPVFFTQQTHDVARIGDLKVQATETREHIVPPFLGGGILVLGAVLIGAGFLQRR